MAFNRYEMVLSDRQWFNFICGMQAGLVMKNADEPNADIQPTSEAGGPVGDSPNAEREVDPTLPVGMVNIAVPSKTVAEHLWVYEDELTFPIYTFIVGDTQFTPSMQADNWGSQQFGGMFMTGWGKFITEQAYDRNGNPLSKEQVLSLYSSLFEDVEDDPSSPNYHWWQHVYDDNTEWQAHINPNDYPPTEDLVFNAIVDGWEDWRSYVNYDNQMHNLYLGLPEHITDGDYGDQSSWGDWFFSFANNTKSAYSKFNFFNQMNNAPSNIGISTNESVGDRVSYKVLIYVPSDLECRRVRLSLAVGESWSVDSWLTDGDADITSVASSLLYELPYKYYDRVVSVAEAGGSRGIISLMLDVDGGVLHQGWHEICLLSEQAVDVVSDKRTYLWHSTNALRDNIMSLQIDGRERLVEERPAGTYVGRDAPARYNHYVGLLNALTIHPNCLIKYRQGSWVPPYTHPQLGPIPGHYNQVKTYSYSQSFDRSTVSAQYQQWGYWLSEDSYATDRQQTVVDTPEASQFIGTLVTLRVSANKSKADYSAFIEEVGGSYIWGSDSEAQVESACVHNGYVQYTGVVSVSKDMRVYIALFDADGNQVIPGVAVDLLAGDNQVTIKAPLYNDTKALNGEYELRAFICGTTPTAIAELGSVKFNEGTAVSQSSAGAPRLLSNPFAKDHLVFDDKLTVDVVTVQGDVDEDVEEDLIFEDSTDVDVHKSFDGNVDVTDTFGINDEEDDETTSS